MRALEFQASSLKKTVRPRRFAVLTESLLDAYSLTSMSTTSEYKPPLREIATIDEYDEHCDLSPLKRRNGRRTLGVKQSSQKSLTSINQRPAMKPKRKLTSATNNTPSLKGLQNTSSGTIERGQEVLFIKKTPETLIPRAGVIDTFKDIKEIKETQEPLEKKVANRCLSY